MRAKGEGVSWRGLRLWLTCLMILSATASVTAQDLYVTNLSQLVAEAYSTEHCFYFPLIPFWAYSLDGMRLTGYVS
jgi:hypothetical protein